MAITWTKEAEDKVNTAPIFIRAFAKKKVEKAAAEQGVEEITVEFMQSIQKKMMG